MLVSSVSAVRFRSAHIALLGTVVLSNSFEVSSIRTGADWILQGRRSPSFIHAQCFCSICLRRRLALRLLLGSKGDISAGGQPLGPVCHSGHGCESVRPTSGFWGLVQREFRQRQVSSLKLPGCTSIPMGDIHAYSGLQVATFFSPTAESFGVSARLRGGPGFHQGSIRVPPRVPGGSARAAGWCER